MKQPKLSDVNISDIAAFLDLINYVSDLSADNAEVFAFLTANGARRKAEKDANKVKELKKPYNYKDIE